MDCWTRNTFMKIGIVKWWSITITFCSWINHIWRAIQDTVSCRNVKLSNRAFFTKSIFISNYWAVTWKTCLSPTYGLQAVSLFAFLTNNFKSIRWRILTWFAKLYFITTFMTIPICVLSWRTRRSRKQTWQWHRRTLRSRCIVQK